jgi:hypothetical protein
MLKPVLRGTLAASAIAFALAGPALAQANPNQIALFKVVTAKDDIVVGWTKAEVEAMGHGALIDVVAGELQRAGQLSVWQFATLRDKDGQLKTAPLKRIVIFAPGTARIEPYVSAYDVLAPN